MGLDFVCKELLMDIPGCMSSKTVGALMLMFFGVVA